MIAATEPIRNFLVEQRPRVPPPTKTEYTCRELPPSVHVQMLPIKKINIFSRDFIAAATLVREFVDTYQEVDTIKSFVRKESANWEFNLNGNRHIFEWCLPTEANIRGRKGNIAYIQGEDISEDRWAFINFNHKEVRWF